MISDSNNSIQFLTITTKDKQMYGNYTSQAYRELQEKYKKLLLNKNETAKELRVSVATIDRLRKSGKLKSKKIGGSIFFTLQEIATFIGA